MFYSEFNDSLVGGSIPRSIGELDFLQSLYVEIAIFSPCITLLPGQTPL